MRLILRGESEAWERFSAIYAPVVYGWARQAGLQECDACDVCQNVFVSLVKNLPKFRHDRPGNSLRAWLRTITKNAVVDWARKRQKQVGQPTLAHEELEKALARSEEDGSVKADRDLIVRRALDLVRGDFEPATWQMFWQFQIEGRTAEEVAAERDVSVWSVYKARSRVLTRLRELLEEFFPTETGPWRPGVDSP